MEEKRLIQNNNIVRLWLFKVGVLLSVFSFSGFNHHIQYSFQESVKSELLETRNQKQPFYLNQYNKLSFTQFLSDIELFSSWALLNFNRSISSQLKSQTKETISLKFSTINLPAIIYFSSSDDDDPLLSIA